jgi:hypothetical protein
VTVSTPTDTPGQSGVVHHVRGLLSSGRCGTTYSVSPVALPTSGSRPGMMAAAAPRTHEVVGCVLKALILDLVGAESPVGPLSSANDGLGFSECDHDLPPLSAVAGLFDRCMWTPGHPIRRFEKAGRPGGGGVSPGWPCRRPAPLQRRSPRNADSIAHGAHVWKSVKCHAIGSGPELPHREDGAVLNLLAPAHHTNASGLHRSPNHRSLECLWSAKQFTYAAAHGDAGRAKLMAYVPGAGCASRASQSGPGDVDHRASRQ